MTIRMRINPRNFFTRELSFLPPHFKNIAVKAHEYDVDQMRKWIYEHCAGRYSITRDVLLKNGDARSVTIIGFEEPGDLTLFALSGMAQPLK
tara:strand:- start:517 stop:792 length:276 start_codon:yes stop_codon:yes gene_type:complete